MPAEGRQYMKLKTLLATPFLNVHLDGEAGADRICDYAISFAQSQGAHLALAVATLRMTSTSSFLPEVRNLVTQANSELWQEAEATASRMKSAMTSGGLSGETAVLFDDLGGLGDKICAQARLGDVTILQPEDVVLSLRQQLLERVLFESGRPVILVPQDWNGEATPQKILVTWDGSAKSARAVGDALPLLSEAAEIEIVSVGGDPNKSKTFEGASIARHLSRYNGKVSVTQLNAIDGDIARAIGDHARLVRANLLVMGAYAHSRWRQLVLGGVTQAVIHKPPVPVFMSY